MAEESSYVRMLRHLRSTGLYRLDGSTRTEIELQCYAKMLDNAQKRIDLIGSNRFPEMMTSDVCWRWQVIYSLPKRFYIRDTRELVALRESVTNRDFTRAGVLRCMASGGFTAQLTENFSTGEVTVKVTDDRNVFETQEEKENFLRGCLPCHVKPVFVWN